MSFINKSTPLKDRFHMPGEFEKHAGTCMLRPERPNNWRLGGKPARKAFVGDATNILSSLMLICTRLGMHFTHAAPDKYQAPKQWLDWAQENCEVSGGAVRVTDDPIDAVKDADFINTDFWWWVKQEAEIPERQAAFMPRYQVNMDLLSKAPAHCKFMHCLPASRGVEATDKVMDSAQSVIFDQAENRLHTEKGLLVWLVYPRLQHPSTELQAYHRGTIENFLKSKF